ncbi:hypothetical protein SNOG_00448 [Parastagonospora nodorum SN15]|uniref:Uncharacterized protein n=1 Tax=Phaeosphaeria nodorum (strain SN15 / ATCC MYA-4574 / FGSC 10173) TaxID=321614 RepID=Q0V6B6_PHANO|nr:hypothetical protein SNOG_00448 [Parastagonospora nodorum SN15]EAT91943.1 hypothetical protein SNOG_00448 [Parastagonospora nodorum SN15]
MATWLLLTPARPSTTSVSFTKTTTVVRPVGHAAFTRIHTIIQSSGLEYVNRHGEVKDGEASPQMSDKANDVSLIEPTVDISRRYGLQSSAREDQGYLLSIFLEICWIDQLVKEGSNCME